MSFCSRCGAESAPGVKFCPKCGNPLEAANVGGAPVQGTPVAPINNAAPVQTVAIPNPLANVDLKDPTMLLTLISAAGALFTLIGGLIFAFSDYYEYRGGSPFVHILTMLTFIAPTVLVALYFLNIGGLGKNNVMLTINFASLAAYPLFYLINYIILDSFDLYTFLYSFGIIAAAALALYCGMGGFKNKTLFTIVMTSAIALEGGILPEMGTAIAMDEYFWMFAALCAFVARIAIYMALLLFVTGRKEA